ncbi:MAG: hypothetical protein AAFQ27_11315 [Pseudomonadota bacterium]
MPKVELKLWSIGVLMLVALIVLGAVVMGDSAFSLPDHQSAGTAARVDEIQTAWKAEGYLGLHTIGMVGDLVFIVVYSVGAWRAGTSLRAYGGGFLSILGLFTMAMAVLFFVTDITETTLQLVQMLTAKGVDWMAGVAAFAQPIKMAAFVASFFAVLMGWLVARFT